MPSHDATTYYARRAPYYETLYSKPERQSDLAELKQLLKTVLANRRVLEIACGTGYWTQAIAETAASVLATDINEPMLHIARQKIYPPNKVSFEAVDMNTLQPGGNYNALFGGFIWSHIPLQDLEQWLDQLHQLLTPGSLVVFTDNNFVAGSNTPISSKDHHGNEFQTRHLTDGATYEIIKNFPLRRDFDRILENRGRNIHVENLPYYWVLTYEIP